MNVSRLLTVAREAARAVVGGRCHGMTPGMSNRGPGSDDEGKNGEDRKERLVRELIELLNELRVALPGVQVLRASCLRPLRIGSVISRTCRWDAFVVALLSTSCAIVLFMTPDGLPPASIREGDKEQILTTSNRLSIAGIR